MREKTMGKRDDSACKPNLSLQGLTILILYKNKALDLQGTVN